MDKLGSIDISVGDEGYRLFSKIHHSSARLLRRAHLGRFQAEVSHAFA
jgi:hypothetical protein